MVPRSLTEAKYQSLASCDTEVLQIKNLLHKLHVECPSVPRIFYDNIGATYLSVNPIFYSRSTWPLIIILFMIMLLKSPSLFLTSPPKINWLMLLPSHYILLFLNTCTSRSISLMGVPSCEGMIKLIFHHYRSQQTHLQVRQL